VSKPLRIDGDAEAELLEASLWYERERPGLGRLFLDEARHCVDAIRREPAIGSRVPGLPATARGRRVLMRRFPYAVVFLELRDEVRILAFAHSRRRPGYWRGRLLEEGR